MEDLKHDLKKDILLQKEVSRKDMYLGIREQKD